MLFYLYKSDFKHLPNFASEILIAQGIDRKHEIGAEFFLLADYLKRSAEGNFRLQKVGTMKKTGLLGVIACAAMATSGVHAQETYEIWHYYAAGSELAGMEAMIANGNASVENAQFSGVIIPGNVVELRRQLQTAFLGGQPPAAYQSSMAFELKAFVDGGRLHPLTDVWAEIGGDEIFPEGVQRVVKIDGIPYGVPFDLSLINNVFYNTAIFEELGLETPTDWDSFTQTCMALADAGYQPLGNAGGTFWSLYNFYAPLVSVLGEDGYYQLASGELGFDTPEFSEALDLYRDMMVSCYADNWSGKTWTQTADDVINGDTGMFMMGIWVGAYFEQADFLAGEDFDVFQAPGTVGKSIFQMDVLAVPEGPEAGIAAAEDFIVAAASPEGQAAFAVPKGSLAPNVNVDPSVYGYAGARFAEQFAEASAANAVLPNLFFLLPTAVGTELGVQIERFAIDPSDTVKAELIATLESLRQQALAEDAYISW
tara:strand:- start:4351 stop:5799 length:1449 start_codon:yes stop_codon:yes gene_type:complete